MKGIQATMIKEDRSTVSGLHYGKSDGASSADSKVIDSLKASTNRYSCFFNSSPDGFALTDEKGSIIEWNHRMAQLTGREMFEVIGMSLWDAYAMIVSQREGQESPIVSKNRKEIKDLFDKWHDLWQDRSFEVALPGKNCAIKAVIFPIRSENGLMLGIQAREATCLEPGSADMSKAGSDPSSIVSKQPNGAKAVSTGMTFGSLNGKAVSSLQKLSGLKGSPSSDLNEGINEEKELGRIRIKSIALVYDLLSKSASLDRISIAVYISSLVEMITRSSRAGQSRISFVLDVEDVLLRPESVVSCGLIINEIISNSIRCISPNGKKRIIRIEFRSLGASIYRLAIGDNGMDIGLDDGDAPLRSALNSLMKEIEGRINIDVSSGNRAEIYFNELKYDSRLNAAQDRRHRQ